MDEDELERELEELEQEQLDKELLDVGPAANVLPDVPTEDLPERAKEKEKKKGEHASWSTGPTPYLPKLICTFSGGRHICRGRQRSEGSAGLGGIISACYHRLVSFAVDQETRTTLYLMSHHLRRV